jgi:hypothetical protein
MREILDIINEMSEEQSDVELHDEFDIELSEDVVIESGVIDINEDGIIIEADDKALALLEEHGLILEETDWSKYDEPTVSRIKKGITKPIDRTDYNKPTYQRKKEKEEADKKKLDEKMVMGLPGDQGSKVMGEDDMDEAKYHGKEVPLGKKLPGDVKKSKVYVRKPNGKIVKVNFGDKKMRIKKSNPKRRKSFRARHNCKNPGPRWKARYWSCRSW